MKRKLAAIFCLIPMLALADYPDPRRKQDQVDLFTKRIVWSPGEVVVTGSSSIRRWRSIQDDLAPAAIIATGIPGTNINDLDFFLDQLVLRYQPGVVVIYQGDNDTRIETVSVRQILGKFDRIVERINQELPDTTICIMSVKPNIKHWDKWPMSMTVNEQLAQRAERHDRMAYVDVASALLDERGQPRNDVFLQDGLHLNDRGYRIWTSILRSVLAGPCKHMA